MSSKDNKIDYSPIGPNRFNMPGVTPISPVETAKYWQDNWKELQKTYGLKDDDFSLILPMLMSGASQGELFSYIQNLSASHKETEYNEGATAREISALRSAGYNPDLSGSIPSGSASMALPKSSPFGIQDLPSRGGTSTLSEKFTNVAGLVLKTMSFGLQAYNVISGNLISGASMLAGLANEDVLNVTGNSNGVVQDVDSVISNLIASRGLKGRKAKQYASFVANRINSTLAVTGRLRALSDKAVASYDKSINEFKVSPDYVSTITSYLQDVASMQALEAEKDLKIQKVIADWYAEHPEVPAQELELALAGKVAETTEKKAKATEAVNMAGISAENLKQEQSNTDAVISENEVKKVRSKIEYIELSGLDDMIEFCKRWENMKATADGYFDMGLTPEQYRKSESMYKAYKKLIKEYRGKGSDRSMHGSVKTPIGSISF